MNSRTYFVAYNPATERALEGSFINSSAQDIHKTVLKAVEAFAKYRKKDKESIASFLEQIADEILHLGNELIERCHLETGLPLARLEGERGRTIHQLKLFAALVREGSWVDAQIDTAIPDRIPLPKPDIRKLLIPLGPVAVFGASNFPLAFSTAGGDTASALAAGCPVIVKGHEAHPGTSALIAKAISKAIQICGMPEGTFSLLQGNSKSVGEALVKHPEIKAVGFTGSFAGGKALFDYANARPEPIPVFAEMGSTNPVFILPGILKEKGVEIAAGLANSIAMGVGQFCTNPGICFIEKSEGVATFYNLLKQKINEIPAGTMLTSNIKKAFDNGIRKTKNSTEVEIVASGQPEVKLNSSSPILFKTSVDNFLKNHSLSVENFGPSSIIVEADTKEAVLDAASNLEGHLTATIFGNENDIDQYRALFDILELKVGRIIINGFPTGVEVCHSIVHGGPFPATTCSQSTSVGTNAIKRFVRPICFQDYPDSLLPAALKNENPLNIWRLINGSLTQSKIK
ncbi:aldehyde dehydrogenase (NADP(+)) [Flavobacterium nackdongense]|uniref:Aldehyde dehydrogenase (NADP(+)) n=1 Tax=Flavobacterium nackdongense TaxID=2547394 RepID=A0A4P6YAY9_9FLAO|nr:aldehyde dehydrogenase (NADP(+)) [Flavobacterium nackdongense]QBN17450.1 aldehyde dehydrogenase (NADP(+)) [Flavobacterium nackdongense]